MAASSRTSWRGGDCAYPEWHTRGRHKLYGGQYEVPNNTTRWNEDDEDDDPAGGNVDDEPQDPEEDRCLAGDDGVLSGALIMGGADNRLRPGHEIGSETPSWSMIGKAATKGCDTVATLRTWLERPRRLRSAGLF